MDIHIIYVGIKREVPMHNKRVYGSDSHLVEPHSVVKRTTQVFGLFFKFQKAHVSLRG